MGFSKLKIIVLAVFVLSFAGQVNAQTFSEFFRQKKTQQKYLLEQLAALKLYAGYVKKGYDIVGSGLDLVRDFSDGEFSLHKTYFNSLKAVSPVVKSNGKVAEIIVFQLEISKVLNSMDVDFLEPGTAAYLQQVKAGVLQECDTDLDELLLVITAEKLEMKDDERLRRLDRVYENMLDKYAFVQSFSNQLALLVGQRKREKQSINQLKQLHERP